MDKYFIYLKPEFESDLITKEHFCEFFIENGFEILERVKYLDSLQITIEKSGVLIARKDKLMIKYIFEEGVLMSYYDNQILDIFRKFGAYLKFATYIQGENQEEY